MSTQRMAFTVLLIVAFVVPGMVSAQPSAPQAEPVSQETGSLLFIENAGQWPEDARYQVWGSPLGVGTTWLAEDAIWISIVEREDVGTLERWNVEAFERSNVKPADGQGVNLKLTFPGANPDVRMEPFDPVDTTVSYFLGNDPEHVQHFNPRSFRALLGEFYPRVEIEVCFPWILAIVRTGR